jgi:two-component system CitB family sensor kinase
MFRARSHRWAFSTRNVLILVVLLLAVVLVMLTGAAAVLRHDLSQEYEQRALAIARAVAQEPGLASDVTASEPRADGAIQHLAERVRAATGALYVVVTDRDGVRYSHPNLANIGGVVSTSPDEALAGAEVATVERGTLGLSARGKVPLRDDSGRIVGEISVGIGMDAVNARAWQLVLVLGLVGLAALGLGIAGAISVGRRLRRTTLGLEPEEMADLVREHAAVLGGVRDGIVAVDAQRRLTVINPEAVRLLGAEPQRGTHLTEAGLPSLITDLFEADPAPTGSACVLGDRVVVVHRMDVRREGRHLGHVLTLRDRTDLDATARELEATRALTDALRAQAHEHRNRLHALGGMLHLGHVEEAEGYLDELSDVAEAPEGIGDAYLAGLVAAKAAIASEAGVRLEVVASSYVEGTLTAPLDVVTVIGNLLDNAIRAAACGPHRPALVELTLVSDGADLLAHVVDSGAGVPEDDRERIFQQGFTTRDGHSTEHGIGLSVARFTARAHHGDVTLTEPGGDRPGSELSGAVFTARLADVLTPARAGAGR